ncbi:hypothetical protein NLJ89_g6603 [Agrocybe chaxingu]|uniref:Uncharacterized protein n=1 Tax=Agrocybe chaxingu TaxID=84603 RepID=A0A9W8MW86_9AGAR|nr:hypothetical protein NLJ89_g6603 [Agrocybe chaxingu]
MPSQEPRDAVTELRSAGDDINRGFGGDFTWIVSAFTSEHNSACTGFQIAVQEKTDAQTKDPARGREERVATFSRSPPAGYHGMSADLNKDRKGSFLYVVWQVWEQPLDQRFVSNVGVVYGTMPSQEPEGAITDIYDGGDDISKDFGGSFVWLVPSFTADIRLACTNFSLAIQNNVDDRYQDLTKGAGFDVRYLLPISDVGSPYKITSLRLLRSSSAVSSPPQGYVGMSVDSNRDRKKDYLYLIWKAVFTSGPTFVSGVNVAYGDMPSEEPRGAVTELRGKGGDINKDFGGSYVWIVPIYKTDARNACTDLQILIQDDRDARYDDLARGPGDFEHPPAQIIQPNFISSLWLPDINKDWKGSYLYLVWTKTILPSTAGPTPGSFDIPADAPANISRISNLNMLYCVLVDVPGMSKIVFSGTGFDTLMTTPAGKDTVTIDASSDVKRTVLVKIQHSTDGGRSYRVKFGSECDDNGSYNDAQLLASNFLPNPSIPSPIIPGHTKRSANMLYLHAKVYFRREDGSGPELEGEITVDFDMDYEIAVKGWFTQPGGVGNSIDPAGRNTKAVAELRIYEEPGSIFNWICVRWDSATLRSPAWRTRFSSSIRRFIMWVPLKGLYLMKALSDVDPRRNVPQPGNFDELHPGSLTFNEIP